MKREDLVPRIDFFQNNGIWTGSIAFPNCLPMEDEFRYRLEPAESIVKGYIWHGPYCFSYCKEKNNIYSEAVFPMDEDGMQQLFHWLETSYDAMKNGNCPAGQTF